MSKDKKPINGQKVTLPEEKSAKFKLNDKALTLHQCANVIHEMNLLQWRGWLRDTDKPVNDNLSPEELGRLIELGEALGKDKRWTSDKQFRENLKTIVGSFAPGGFQKHQLPELYVETLAGIDTVVAIQGLARTDEVDQDLLEFKRIFLTEVAQLIQQALGGELENHLKGPKMYMKDGRIDLTYFHYLTTQFKYSYQRIPETEALACSVTFRGYPLVTEFWVGLPGTQSDISIAVDQAQQNAKKLALEKLASRLAFNEYFKIKQEGVF